MRFISRSDQNAQAYGSSYLKLDDNYFDGVPLPRTIRPRAWLPEGSVHRERVLSTQIDSTRYFVGPQNCAVRDDNRRVTWVAFVETPTGKVGRPRLMLHKFPGSWPSSTLAPASESRLLAEGPVWRYHIALNKYTGDITATWITRDGSRNQIWLDGKPVDTKAVDPDFPFFAYSQPPIGHVATEPPPFAIFTYKCRKSGQLFVRRVEDGKLGPENGVDVGAILGGMTVGISGNQVVGRVDLLGSVIPTLTQSSDAGKTFSKPQKVDLAKLEKGFQAVPGFHEPIVDVGGNFHAPIHVSNGNESAALNHVVRENATTEAIRVDGTSRISNSRLVNQAISQASLEVFPATLGNPNAYGNGMTDGHGLIMVLSAEGRLFSSNSSAGGLYFPEPALLNYEMPLVGAFSSTECYTSGHKPNFVSMDYLYIEADAVGRPVSSDLHFETWDMPLPVPVVSARASGGRVEITAESDMDLEPGQVSFSFSDPATRITDVKVTGLRTATVETDAKSLHGQTVRVDVDALFHRHYAEAVIS